MFKHKLYMILFVFALFLGGAKYAKAQSGDVFFGVGSASDKSNGQVIDTFGNGINYSSPALGGPFGVFGADYMIKPVFGVGFNYATRFTQGPYDGLNYRPKFYDFNGIWMPISNSKTVAPIIQGGIGAASLSFYYPSQCISGIACTSSTYLTGSTHFQVHIGIGVNVYVKGGIFIRPQIDAHYVRNFYQFGSDWAPVYSVAIGYTFGRQH